MVLYHQQRIGHGSMRVDATEPSLWIATYLGAVRKATINVKSLGHKTLSALQLPLAITVQFMYCSNR